MPPPLPRRDVHLDPVVPQHRDRRLADERVVVVGEHVHEVRDRIGSGIGVGCDIPDARSPIPTSRVSPIFRARRRNVRWVNRGSVRRRDRPNSFSISHRAGRLPSRALAVNAKLLASAASASVRASTQSARSRPCSAWWAALASSISFGTSTRAAALVAAHLAVDAQLGDLAHLVGGQRRRVGSRRSSRRSRFALARGVAASAPVARNTGHIRSPSRRARQSPQPLHVAATIAGVGRSHTSSGSGVLGSRRGVG